MIVCFFYGWTKHYRRHPILSTHNLHTKTLTYCGFTWHQDGVYVPCREVPGTVVPFQCCCFCKLKNKFLLLARLVHHWSCNPFISLTHCYHSTLHSLAVWKCWCKMWQTFPEHTKKFDNQLPRESLQISQHICPQQNPGPCIQAAVSVVTILPFMDICLDAEATEYGTIWHLAAPAKQRCRLGRKNRVGEEQGLQTH